MEQHRHWWNGRWGRLARQDIFLRTDAGRWYVEERTGGAEGSSRHFEFATEEAAYDAVGGLLGELTGWRQHSPRLGDLGR